MRRDGTSVQTNNINLISTDVTQHDVKPDRNLLKNLDDLITPIHTIKANNENWRSYIQYQIHQLDDYTPDAVTKDNMFIHKLAVVNGEVVEDVAQVPDHVDEKQQQEELEQTLRYIEEMRSKYYTIALDDLSLLNLLLSCGSMWLIVKKCRYPIDGSYSKRSVVHQNDCRRSFS